MIRLPIKYRSDDDDYAPVDYQFVGSVAEGRQRREAEAIHQGTDKAVVRRSAAPDARVDAYGTHARRSSVVEPARPHRVERGPLRGEDGPRVQRIAYPEGAEALGEGENERAEGLGLGVPPMINKRAEGSEGPGLGAPPMMNKGVEGSEGLGLGVPPMINKRAEGSEGSEGLGLGVPPMINKRAEGSEGLGPGATSGIMETAEGSFDPPVAPEIPEWLKVAKQNNLPMADGRFRPRVVAAPMQTAEDRPTDRLGRPVRGPGEATRPIPPLPQVAEDYRTAGYPPELLAEQERRDAEQEASQYGYRRRGAQRAVSAQADRNEPAQRSGRHAPPGNPFAPGSSSPSGNPSPSGSSFSPRAARPPRSLSPEEQGIENQWSGREQGAAGRGYAGDYEASYAPYTPPAWQGYEQAPMPGRLNYGPADTPYALPQSPVRPYPERGQSAQDPQNPYVQEPWADELPTVGRNIPWLGIAAGALALAAALLWIFQMVYTNRAEEALLARERTQQAISDAHPYKYRELIETQAQINNLHPAFIAAIVLNESSFRPDAESSVGARGLMQMMPDTAEWVHGKIGQGEGYSFDMMYDANTNVRYACWYMNYLSEKFRGDPVLVAAAFHAGQGTVQNWLNDSRYSADSQTIALEDMMDGPTKSYAERVLKAYAAYKRLYYESMGG